MAGNPISAEDSVELDNTAAITTSIDKTEDGVINGNGESAEVVVRGSVSDVEDGQTVTVVLSDGTNEVSVEAVVENGEYVTEATDVSAFVDGTITATASVSDVAGNPISAEDSVELDNTAEITVSLNDTDQIINQFEQDSVVFSGSVTDIEPGQPITLTLTDSNDQEKSVTTNIDQNGQWQVTSDQVQELADGDIVVHVAVSDQALNPAEANVTFVKDTQASLTIAIEQTDDGVINGNEEQSLMSLSGTVAEIEDGQSVLIQVSDGVNPTIEVSASVVDGLYRVENIDISSLNNGTITASASTQDVAGNTASAADSVQHDKLASITVDIDDTSDFVINGNSENTQVDISGTVSDIEDDQVVTVVVSDGSESLTFTAQVNNGRYLIEGVDLSSLNDGTLTAVASALDVAGNLAQNSDTAEHDKIANTTIEVDATDLVVNNSEKGHVVVTGVVEDIETGQTVSVTFSDGSLSKTVTTSVDDNGQWQIEPSDISDLADGEISAQVSIFDQAGNEATNSSVFEKDTQATITLDVNDDVINAAEDEAVVISGQVGDVESTNVVTLTFTDQFNSDLVLENIALDEQGRWTVSNADISTLSDGQIDVAVSVFDDAGNEAVNHANFIKDTQATTSLTVADDLVNATEQQSVLISGQSAEIEPTNTAKATFTDSDNKQVVIDGIALDGDGAWSVNADISSLLDGNINVLISIFDDAGNEAVSQSSFEKDTQAEVSVNVGDDEYINAQEQNSAVIAGNVDDIEAGQEVDITLKDSDNSIVLTGTVEVDDQGNWQLESSILRFLSDGEYSVEVSSEDIAGNPAVDVLNFTKDTLASTTIALSDNVFNATEVNDLSVTGVVSDIELTNKVSVTLTDTDGKTITLDNIDIDSDGQWQINNQDISTLADGSITVSVNVSDLAGNTATNQASFVKDTYAELSVEIDDTADDVINGNSENTAVTLSGTALGIEDGRTVTVEVTDGTATLTFSAEVSNEAYVINNADISDLADGTITANASASDSAGNQVTAQDAAIHDKTGVTTIEVATGNDNAINTSEQGSVVVSGVIEEADSTQTATVVFTDENDDTVEISGVAIDSDGNWAIDSTSISDLADGEITVSVSALDVEGNLATNNTTFSKDTTIDITVDINDTDDNVINGNNENTQVAITGTTTGVEDGQTVTVTVRDGDGNSEIFTATVSNNAYQISGADVSALNDGTLTARAEVSDVAGNSDFAEDSATHDKTASTTIEVASGDDVVNSDEQSNVVISGVVAEADESQTATVTFSDEQGQSVVVNNVAVNSDGEWQIAPSDISSLDDGEITVSVSVLDVEGNLAQNTTSFNKDTYANLSVEIDDTADDVINGNSENTTVTLSGLALGIEDGRTVTVEVTDGTETLTFSAEVSNEAYVINNADISDLADGTITANASASDSAGNQVTAQDTAIHDKTGVTTIEVATGNDNAINTSEQATVVVSGVIEEADSTQTATVVFTDENDDTVEIRGVAIDSDGNWAIDSTSISGLADGEIAVSVSALDVEGNLATNNTTFSKDTTIDITVDINDTDDNVINGNSENTQVVITGTTTGVEDGQTVTVTVRDGDGNSEVFTATVSDNAYQVNGADVSALNDGTLTARAEVSDVAGNSDFAEDSATHDKTASTTIEVASGDDVVNSSEQTHFQVSGQVTDIENTQAVKVTLIDSDEQPMVIENIAIDSDGGWQLPETNISILADGDIRVTVSVFDQAGNEAINSTQFNKDTQASITIATEDNDVLINDVEKTAVVITGQSSEIEVGRTIDLVIEDTLGETVETQVTIAEGGQWVSEALDLSALSDGALSITATGTDLAGNEAIGTLNVVKDTQSGISVEIDDDNRINNEEQADARVSGQVTDVEANQVVDVTIKNAAGESVFTGTAVVDELGNWQLDSSILSVLSDGDYRAEVSTSDVAGNPSSSFVDFTKDTQASTTIELADDVVNGTEQTAVSISGQVDNIEDTNTVSVTLTDADGKTITLDNIDIDSDGQWQITDQDISTLADGSITVSVNVSDLAGNTATNQASFVKDTYAELSVEIDDTADDVINGNSENTAVTLSGSALGIEDGRTVTVEVTDGTETLTFSAEVSNEAYVINNADISGLADGTITANASASDSAGNQVTAQDTAIHDKTGVTTIEVATGNDNAINTSEQGSVVVSGVIEEADSTQTATVVFTDENDDTVEISGVAIDSDGNWAIDSTSISDLADGEIAVSVSALDVEGNLATNNTTFSKDTTIDITVDINDTDDNVINGNSENTQVAITGTTTGVEDGQTVTVTVRDGDGNSEIFTATVSNNVYQISSADVSALNDGTLTARAEVSDVAGNSDFAEDSATHDKTASTTIEVASGDDVVNSDEQSNVVISGVVAEADESQTATVTFSDEQGQSVVVNNVAVNSDGEWQITPSDISSLDDGEITVSVSVLDVEGNLAQNTTSLTKDTTVNIDIDTTENGINSRAFKAGDITSLSGSTDAEQGSIVTLVVSDGVNQETINTAVDANGEWQANGIDVSGLNETQPWTITASVSDNAGNLAQDDTPILDALDTQTLNENDLLEGGTSTATSNVNSSNAALSLSADQSGLAGLTVDNQAVSVAVASDGQSLEVRDSNNNLVISIVLLGTQVSTTLHASVDHESASLSTDIFVDALQTDSDGTSELIVVPTELVINDSAPISQDDTYTVTEALTGDDNNGNLLDNDTTLDGDAVLTSVVFGADTYTVTQDTPAVVETGEGTLTVNQDGSWTFAALDNRDSSTPPSFSIDYTITDSDGVSTSTSEATFTVQDGTAGQFSYVTATYTEGVYGQTATKNKTFSIAAGSDQIDADSIVFDDTVADLDALGLTSAGDSITFELLPDGKTIIGSTDSSEVIRFTVSTEQDADGKSIDGNVETLITLPIDNPSGNSVNFDLSLYGEDNDGTVINGAGNVTITLNDGDAPSLANIDSAALDESNLASGSNVATGQLDTVLGSDSFEDLTFANIASQPSLTADGIAVEYTLSADGTVLTAHTGDVNDPVFIATLPAITTTESQTDLSYQIELIRPIDNNGDSSFDLAIELSDQDGDVAEDTITVTVTDSANATQTSPELSVAENPSLDTTDQSDTQTLTITAGGEDVVDLVMNVTTGEAVLDSNGSPLTQNGQAITWLVNGDGTAQGVIGNDVVFTITLPSTVEVTAGQSTDYDVSVTLSGAIDHLDSQSENLSIQVPIASLDNDGTRSESEFTVSVDDGQNAVVSSSVDSSPAVDEEGLRTDESVTTSGEISITQGSDEIVEVKLADGFSFDGYTSGGEAVSLASDADSNGWFNATANVGEGGTSDTVFRVKFNADGTFDYEQFYALDHSSQGEDTLDVVVNIVAVDADGDISNSSNIVIATVTDDTPTITGESRTLVEGETINVNLLDNLVGGADGASVSSITYQGVDRTVGTDFSLVDENNNTYATATINADGSVTIETTTFNSTTADYIDAITYEITDGDGDIASADLSLTVSDDIGEITVTATDINEDGSSTITIELNPGDIDQGESVSQIRILASSLQGGSLSLNNTPLSPDNDGYYVLTVGNGLSVTDGVATIDGSLTFTPLADSSNETQDISLEIDATVSTNNGDRTYTATQEISVTSVADTPDWSADNVYSYSTAEDTAVDVVISASLSDSDGSETLTYLISGLDENLVLTANGRTLANGDTLSESEVQSLQVSGDEHVSGSYNFSITAIATESENDDTAQSNTQTVTVDITPVADEPRLFVRNQTVDEDSLINANLLFSGELVDQDGSEVLSYEVVLPDGFELVDSNGDLLTQNSEGAWLVSDSDLTADNVFVRQAQDISRANDTVYQVQVVAIATEQADTSNPATTELKTLELTVIGQIDPPELDEANSNANWAFAEVDENNFTLTNESGVEDTRLQMDFLITTSDIDGSEFISLVISELPDSVVLVDVNGDPADLPIVGRDSNGNPMYSLPATEMENYYLEPVGDFSGEVSFNIKVVPTESDGDTSDYNIAVTTEFNPTVDNNSASLATAVVGNEDTPIALDFNPSLLDSDGSESITGAVITAIPDSTTLYVDGEAVELPIEGLNLATLVRDGETLSDVLTSDRVTLQGDDDFSGQLTVEMSYTVTDSSNVGNAEQVINSEVSVTVNGVVDVNSASEADAEVTRIEATDDTLVSTSRTLSLDGAVTFTEADIDGSEYISYIEVILPSDSVIEVVHANGALPDGSGRWVIPIDAGTSASEVDIVDLLAGVTLEAQSSTGVIEVTVGARVVDGSNATVLQDTFTVDFNVSGQGSTSQASEVGQLQITTIDAIEDETVDLTGHINTSLTDDANDTVTIYILGEDLPEGMEISGSGVVAIPGSDGEISEYIIPESALESLSFNSAGTDYSGQLDIPVRIVAVDNDSGDRYVDESQSLQVDITPVTDGGEFTAVVSTIAEDNSDTSLGLSLNLTDSDVADSDPLINGGVESLDFTQPIIITLQAGVGLYDPSGLFTDNGDDTYTYNGTEAQFSDALAQVGVIPVANQASEDVVIELSATVKDAAQLSTGTVNASGQITSTISVGVTAVTDAAQLSAANQSGVEDNAIVLDGLSASLIDDDGSESLSITLSGVPQGSILQDAEGNELVNNGADGGDLNGVTTNSWTVTKAQLDAGIVLTPPLDFSGDIPLTLTALTQDQGAEIVETSVDFVLSVSPEADALDFSKQPLANNEGLEDDSITIDFAAYSEEADDTEQIELTVTIAADSDSSALFNLTGNAFIQVEGQTVYFAENDNGDYSATLISDSSSIENFDFNGGGLAFGQFNMNVETTVIDSAEINGETVTSRGESQSANFTVTLEPQVDTPVWASIGNISSSTTNNIDLGLDLDLQNPATGETAYVAITGLPSGYSFSHGDFDSENGTWTVGIDDIESLSIVNANSGDSFDLTITATAELDGEQASADSEVITVSVSANATASSSSDSSDMSASSSSSDSSNADEILTQGESAS
ncbi:Ig-like domain-containing protein [Vibrio sp. HB161653]|uniref:beta strand repeat-containing protein n=1 Tax=Vibrio sp. HB161653 TaxID=3068274 RepID=UPI00273F0E99|nr:Ig-like domain-containing protein [Vibrio sp. HB161653]MDP5253903.1 Ig-like domain-containing protein [Vibrio sp. HB161653]